MKSSVLLSLLLGAALTAHAQTPQVRVTPGDIDDHRTSGGFHWGMEVELKVSGDVLGDATGIRVSTDKAADDTGRDLIDPEKKDSSFEKTDDEPSVKITLKNPARRATTLKELSGEIDLFIPKNDSNSIATFDSFQKLGGKPLSSPGLAANGIQITAWTKDQYKADQAKEKAKAEAEAKKQNLGGAIGEAMGQLFGGFSDMGDNDLAFHVVDPNLKVVSIEVQDASGKKLRSDSSMTEGEGKEKTTVYQYESKPPADARLVVSIGTDKALVKIPFKLNDVLLP